MDVFTAAPLSSRFLLDDGEGNPSVSGSCAGRHYFFKHLERNCFVGKERDFLAFGSRRGAFPDQTFQLLQSFSHFLNYPDTVIIKLRRVDHSFALNHHYIGADHDRHCFPRLGLDDGSGQPDLCIRQRTIERVKKQKEHQNGQNIHHRYQVYAETSDMTFSVVTLHPFYASAVSHGASPMAILGKRAILLISPLPSVCTSVSRTASM